MTLIMYAVRFSQLDNILHNRCPLSLVSLHKNTNGSQVFNSVPRYVPTVTVKLFSLFKANVVATFNTFCYSVIIAEAIM